jgi:hypothetical protein
MPPDWQKDSARQGVQKALDGASPEDLHLSWCDQKVKAGWRYGPEKNPERKTHPCLLPYKDLPADQRQKDFIFHETVHNMAGTLGII